MPVLNTCYTAVNSLMFGAQPKENLDHFAQIRDRINDKSSGFSQNFVEQSNKVYDGYYSDRALSLARAAMNKASSLFAPDRIRELSSMVDLQTAKPQMQRFIMADPFLRQLKLDKKIDGYADSYFDFQPGVVGENHYDFQLVNTGVVREDPESEDVIMRVYFGELREGDTQPTALEQLDILNTQSKARYFQELAARDGGEDCTSEWGASVQ